MLAGTIDIVCNLFTDHEVRLGQTGVDEAFLNKVRFPQEYRRGVSKVLFGTDWPVVAPERAVKEIEELDLRPEAQQKLLRENALRFFRLPESTPGSAS